MLTLGNPETSRPAAVYRLRAGDGAPLERRDTVRRLGAEGTDPLDVARIMAVATVRLLSLPHLFTH